MNPNTPGNPDPGQRARSRNHSDQKKWDAPSAPAPQKNGPLALDTDSQMNMYQLIRRQRRFAMDMNLDDLIHKATSKISDDYFTTLSVGNKKRWLERPYAYEFYHQMRKCWPKDCCLIISGEVSKAEHQDFDNLDTGKPMPDFLIHRPGTMDDNCAIIEVKSQEANKNRIYRDINKLLTFKYKIRYRRMIYLFFGKNLPKEKSKFCKYIKEGIDCWWRKLDNKDLVESGQFEKTAVIELWWHVSPHKPAQYEEMRISFSE